MRTITLGSTGITVPQNGFGALPIQRTNKQTAVHILRKALDGGMTFYDTARAYSDSEEKLGAAFGEGGLRDKIFIATKSMAKTPEQLREQLDTSLAQLKTDHVDIYQFHCSDQVYRPDDGTGMYECMLEAKDAGKIGHIGITAHKIGVAEEAVESGLYETLQFPFSYLAGPREMALVESCRAHNMGFICMKGLAGGLISNSAAAMAFVSRFDDGLVPIWGIQRESELDEWLSYMEDTPTWTPEMEAFVEGERAELSGNFCRGCGYCMPCPVGITINQCARMSLMVRRAPSANWLSEHWQAEMAKIDECLHCNRCASRCPYELDTPSLLEANLADYRRILAGEVAV